MGNQFEQQFQRSVRAQDIRDMKRLLATGRRLLGQTRRESCAACILVDGQIIGVRSDSTGASSGFTIQPSAAGRENSPLENPAVVACLDRSQYLLKVVEIPSVEPHEVRSALELEIEAVLPPEFGELELSSHPLPCDRSGYQRYEVYVASRTAVGDYLQRLRSVGLRVESLIPSAVAWRRLLETHDEMDVLITPFAGGRLEMAAISADGSLAVRALGSAAGARPTEAEIEAYLVPLLDAMGRGKSAARVGWLSADDDPPPLAQAEPVGDSRSAGNLPLLEEIVRLCADASTNRCDLMPSEQVAGSQWSKALRSLSQAAATVIVGIILIYAAVAISTARLRSAGRSLETDIAQIKGEGETIGRGIEQLSALDAARATRNDFHQIIDGLLSATPPGVTYSQIDYRSSGELVLHGSATSLSLVFTLPQTLEKQSMFSKVLLKDAAQAKSSSGVSAEFDIQCTLARRSVK